MVKLGNDEIKCIALFEQLTGVSAEDCLIEQERVTFVVKPGEAGRAIGRGGETIRRVRDAFRKQVEIFENANTLEGFVRNLFPGVRVKTVSVREKEGSQTAHITVEEKDRGAAIGRGGEKIKLARLMLSRHYGAELKLL
jgi:N utilization substance protein A